MISGTNHQPESLWKRFELTPNLRRRLGLTPQVVLRTVYALVLRNRLNGDIKTDAATVREALFKAHRVQYTRILGDKLSEFLEALLEWLIKVLPLIIQLLSLFLD